MTETALDKIKIILVRPLGPLNVGSVARVMKNMGLTKLALVSPQCDVLGEEARMMAVHGWDILETAQQVNTLDEALIGCSRVAATTGSDRRGTIPLENPRNALPWLLENTGLSALMFGPEDHGLSHKELKYAQRYVRIPSSPAYPSLNLAQSVAICCYELYQMIQQSPLLPSQSFPLPPSLGDTAPIEVMESYYQQMEAVLFKIGYLHPHTAVSRMDKFRLMFNRSQLSTKEVTMLRGIFSQVEWALEFASNQEKNQKIADLNDKLENE